MAFPSTASTWQLQNAKSFRKQTDPCMDQDSCLNLPVALPRDAFALTFLSWNLKKPNSDSQE